ncbi:MAG: GreA/GreB family elongation factor [Verrucomicrobiota bacterium]|nr:GreA/GreB family elongation factor [Verrucomicrobiota bacterium]
MSSEIQKTVEAGKLSAAAGAALEKLTPGTFVLHKSWGFGRINSLDFLVSQVIIDFKTKKSHPMQLQYAAESLKIVPSDHILAAKASNLAAVKARAPRDPVGLLRQILASYGGKATQDQIAGALVPDVMSEGEFKKWFESAKKALKQDGHFAIPSKKSEPFEWREKPVSHASEFLAAFTNTRQLKDQTAALDLILKNLAEFNDPKSQLLPVVNAANEAARKNVRLNTAEALSLILSRDELAEKVGLEKTPDALTVADLLRDEERQLVTLLSEVPAVKLKRALSDLPKAFGDNWTSMAIQLVLRGNTRLVTDTARLLQESGVAADLHAALARAISDHSISSDALNWLCKERKGDFGELANALLLSAILSALERDQHNEKRDRKLHDLLLNDKELITDLVVEASPEELSEVIRKLLRTPVFEELNKRSLLGRVIRLYPEVQSMLSGDSAEKQEALVVSWASLEKRRAEHEELATKKIPENTREISIARSYGDLRENFEYKAAKEMQRVLMRRQAEMQRDLSRARGTDFANVDKSVVSIGTVVTLRAVEDGRVDVYSILGAWDGDPEKGIVSYESALAQSLLGHKVGEQINVPTEDGEHRAEIVNIEAYKK